MESDSQKIINKIEAILPLLELCGGGLGMYYYEYLIDILNKLRKPHEPIKIANSILQIYGGMATFSDVIIWTEGKLLKEENAKFEVLKNELFIICDEIVNGSRFIRS